MRYMKAEIGRGYTVHNLPSTAPATGEVGRSALACLIAPHFAKRRLGVQASEEI